MLSQPATRVRTVACTALIVSMAGAMAYAQRVAGVPEDLAGAYRRGESILAGEPARLVYKTDVEPQWIGNTSRFWYRNDVRSQREFVLVDAEAGTRGPAFDHDRLARALSDASGETWDAQRLPVDEIEFSEDGLSISFAVDGDLWRCDLATYTCARTDPPPTPETPPAAPPRERGQSPDGRYVAFLRDYNVWVSEKEGGEELRMTENGEEGNAFTSFEWSPDSRSIVAFRTTPGDRGEMFMVESAPQGQVRPRLRRHVYDLPGDKLDVHEMWILSVSDRRQIKAATEPIDWWGPPELHWGPDPSRFLFRQIHRGYQRVRVVEVDTETGAARTVIEELSDTFIPPMKEYMRYLPATAEIIWASERDGWNHLYLYDAATGEVRNRITHGEWVVRSVEHMDEEARTLTFAASGLDPDADPYLVKYYRVGFDGSGLLCLTPSHGQHRIRFSPDRRFMVDTYSCADRPPVTELRRASDGELICELERADISDLVARGWHAPEPFRAKGRDGVTDIWGVIYRPSDLDESRAYPVIEDIYAGPQDSFVPKSFAAARSGQALAELGFIVVQIDGMGTSNRSKAFHDVAYKNLGDGGFPDRIAWLRAAAERYPYMDLTRVGIYGGSAGGYNAAHALLAHPEFYKVGVSISGNHDHRTDKVWWNELWMGYPVGDHYVEQSNITMADRLVGKLLLIHGELDDNVNMFASTMQFVDALIRANKDFDLLIVPGGGHCPGGPYVQRRIWDFFVRHLHGVEPPAGLALSRSDTSRHFAVRNERAEAVEIFWVGFDGQLRKYHDLDAGAELRQHSYLGHRWVARSGGSTVSRYTVSDEEPLWTVR